MTTAAAAAEADSLAPLPQTIWMVGDRAFSLDHPGYHALVLAATMGEALEAGRDYLVYLANQNPDGRARVRTDTVFTGGTAYMVHGEQATVTSSTGSTTTIRLSTDRHRTVDALSANGFAVFRVKAGLCLSGTMAAHAPTPAVAEIVVPVPHTGTIMVYASALEWARLLGRNEAPAVLLEGFRIHRDKDAPGTLYPGHAWSWDGPSWPGLPGS